MNAAKRPNQAAALAFLPRAAPLRFMLIPLLSAYAPASIAIRPIFGEEN
jgi:hypothetical protein